MKPIRILSLIMFFCLGIFLIANDSAEAASQGTDYLAFAQVMPQPVGGLKAIYKNITEYPKIAKEAGIQGKVYVLAFINEKGGVDNVKVVRGIGGGCDEAALEAVKKTKFKPGMQKGKPVKVKMTLPIIFKLRG